jgi:Fe-S-cluster formation regulator IscX/YfhJ
MKKILALTLTLAYAPAHAEFYTGNRLLAQMHGTVSEQMAALGYVAGAADVTDGVLHCDPPGVTLKQVHDLVKRALENFPEYRNRSADSIVTATLQATWPCKEKPTGRGT